MSWRHLITNLNARKRLISAFKSGNIYLGTLERPIFPKIVSVKITDHSTQYTFSLPNGLNPDILKRNYFAILQHFGEHIRLEGEVKRYTLTIYSKSSTGDLAYDIEDIREQLTKLKLGIICGKDRTGAYVAFDLLKQPHILIAGETGSGKSTQLRSILTTLILAKKPSELKLYLGDCKKSEFHIFRKVEHVQCVLSSGRDIAEMLCHIKRELDERSDLTETFEVSHIDELPVEHRRPYLVVCIDEFVMLRKDETVMEILTEVVAIGRTLGVFAILSMQRPNAKVLDTTIRVNLTVSMGFKLRDKTEARIVNTPDAEKIEEPGRFVMNSDKLYDLQAPYLEMGDAKELLNPFMVSKGKTKPVTQDQEKLTEEDVFYDAIDAER
ncbi:FtsK/SpoIIIE domain-containing protein [Cytobacillus purgationiresistens]|uniref:S-DNA-T family DNA segregation ATPase FtsK/SpoIIIE n=1 Tax=Cytobacillus purgationiresistens TaxID=863449 RepID=A0ABU0AHH0_9BACI|nr:FtsK/SpoIIIE domain-containing protein [Cytobacillus purgationiresistens]MDQ0270704.1 S-DNA-T family DNA segregation ATPase FtsK/SpoIIIE [Cytobacillus purgationiresistens]